MVAVQTNTIILPVEQKFNFRGVWNPLDGDPLLPAKYDAYVIGCTVGQFEIGDWIIRDGENQSFIHIPVKLYSTITNDMLLVIEDKHKDAVAYFMTKLGEQGIKINNQNTQILDLEEKVNRMEHVFRMIGEHYGS